MRAWLLGRFKPCRLLRLAEGDVLVLTIPLGITPAERQRIARTLERHFPQNRILIVERHFGLSTIVGRQPEHS